MLAEPPAVRDGYFIDASGDWSFVESHDGKRQWAYKGSRFICS